MWRAIYSATGMTGMPYFVQPIIAMTGAKDVLPNVRVIFLKQ